MTIPKTYSFPTFYACYLLKSVQTLRSYRNYIGSTRDPERRLRQHNGVIKQGARETAAYRPWIMQLLVHGFPSKPAATSFEYAWQNPHKSRYLRDDTGSPVFQKRGTRLEQNILVLQKLIRTHPFSTWPLHVKLFTEEAVQCWDVPTSTSPLFPSGAFHDVCSENVAFRQQQDRQRYGLLFPPGFTCSVELEGVHGASGLPGSGRQDPVSVTDEHFTAPYLAKNTALIASGHALKCSICGSPIHDFATNHLGTILCTHTGCTSVSHLTCLAKSWLEIERQPVSFFAPFPSPSSPSHPLHLPASSWSSSERSPHPPSSPVPSTSPRSPTLSVNTLSAPIPASSSSNPFNLGKGMLPRGGTCTSCKTYILWGDVVKGCYRRHTGQVDSATLEAEEDLEEEEFLNSDSDLDSSERLTKELELLTLEGTVSRRGRKARSTSSLPDTSPSARLPGRPRRVEVDSSSRTSGKRGRPRKEEQAAAILGPGVPKGPGQTRGGPGPSEILSHTPEPSSLISAGLRRGPGRPRKQLPTPGPNLSTTRCPGPGEPAGNAGVPNPLPSKSVGVPRGPGRPRKLFPLPVDSPVTSTIKTRPQSGPEIGPLPRRRGEPPKTVAGARNPTSAVDAMASPSTKRRPGRPKKVPTEVGAEYTLSTRKRHGGEPLITAPTLPKGSSDRGGLQSLPIIGVAKTQRKRGRPRSGNRSGDGSSGVADLSIVGLESSRSQTELEVLGKR